MKYGKLNELLREFRQLFEAAQLYCFFKEEKRNEERDRRQPTDTHTLASPLVPSAGRPSASPARRAVPMDVSFEEALP